MKDLIKQYIDHGMSRRQLVSGLSALGMSSVAAKAVAQNLSPLGQGAATPSATDSPTAIRDVEGNGGKIFVEQLKSAGVEYIFFNPSTGDHPIFDALVDVPEITLIKGVQEGAVVAMADGYARASGRTGVVVVANIGLPNAMTQMVNSWKDQVPLLVAVASVDQDGLGPRPVPGNRSSGTDDATHHKMVLAEPVDSGNRRNHTSRAEICFDATGRAGVSVNADQHPRRACQVAGMGAQQIRRADAHSSR